MSAPERPLLPLAGPGVQLAACPMSIVEIAAFRAQAPQVESLAASRGLRLAAPGTVTAAASCLTLSVRPGRWLVLSQAAAPGAGVAGWFESAAERAAAATVDLSAGLAALFLGGPAVREMLTRACRLDLEAGAFPEGRAAATILVQVPAILAALPSGLLLLTPATTAQHLREWLATTSKPFGFALCGDAQLFGDSSA